tara:strand:- start:3241 stop:4041 length:801 start_codon:yes stop_codon:yes gene_type:complete
MLEFAVRPETPQKEIDHSPSAPTIAIIPARYHSSRLPGKPLADINGRTMVEHVYRRASMAKSIDDLLVATDDLRIHKAVTAFGGNVTMTSVDHLTGTDRLAEVSATLSCETIVNVQADEPLIAPDNIDLIVKALNENRNVSVSTLRCPISSSKEFLDKNVVKVVVDSSGLALYFSRAPIPFTDAPELTETPTLYKHIGLYAYRRSFLIELANLSRKPLEQTERLEQLRVLEYGHKIQTIETTKDSVGVDTPEDLTRVRQIVTSGVE